jgi:hypothetical protein
MAEMDLFPCVRDGVCLCSKTWVLVIHNDFFGIDKFERSGNDADIRNLRRVFEDRKNCKFAEMKGRSSTEIVSTLQSEEKLAKLFHPCDESK